MASSSNEKPDVFISFRGTDTRRGILSHLTKKLREKELIDAFVDDKLKSGTEISSSLLEAIEGSLISLIIFSQDYASSRWCLEELEKIMECKEDNGQIVIPIFYNIDPSLVRNQRGTYGDDFAKHEKRFKDKVQNWRSAMNKAANLTGYHYDPSNFESEAEFIDKIVKDVLEKLKNISPTPVQSKHLVGFDRNFEHVQSLLEFQSPEVRILGIWGMGGIGKTTLASAICDKFLSDFESVCFMENIREESEKINGLKYLLHKIYAQLLDIKFEEVNMSNVLAMRFNRRRLSRKKVLIVLDDVDTSVQLEFLLENLCLGAGSRVIITSRNKLVLKSARVHSIYQIEELNFEESLELFSLLAFNQRHPKMGYEELSKTAVSFAKGVPLALEVLGLHLRPIDKEIWGNEIQKLRKYPNNDIQNVLKVSYDGLDETQKNIFLDIAFFFRGHIKDDVKRVLDACGFFAPSGIYQLQHKALISISKDYKRIEMHDLLHEMAEQIVREDSTGRHIKPGRRSRLNDVEEIYEVLQNNKGTDAIEGIILDVCKIKKTHLRVDTFKTMSNLRILIFHSPPWSRGSNLNVPFGLELFSNELRYFRWDEYPWESLPLTFCTAKLVEVYMQHSHRVNSLHMTKLPCMTNLKRLSFARCGQVNEKELQVVFDGLHFLEDLDFAFCMNLCSIPDNISSLPLLKSLALDGSNVEGIPSSIKHLPMLQKISLSSCNRLKSLPELPQSIKYLHVQYCPALIEIVTSNCNNIEEAIDGEGEREKLNLSFKGDVKLGEQGIMQFATSSLIRATKRNSCDPEHEVCYPGSTIPHWFKYKETSETVFVIELDEHDQLLGFVLGGILPKFVDVCNICFFFFFEDHYGYASSNRVFSLGNSNTDLAFLWFCPFEKIAGKGASEGRKYNHILCGFRCEVSGQAVVGTCGVCPIYASQFDNIIGQIFESERHNGDVDDLDYQQETPLELEESYTPDILEIEFPGDQSNTSHDDDDDDNDDVDDEDNDNNDDDDDDDDGENENGDGDDDETKEEEPHFHVKLNRINNFSPLDKQNEKKGLQQLLFP